MARRAPTYRQAHPFGKLSVEQLRVVFASVRGGTEPSAFQALCVAANERRRDPEQMPDCQFIEQMDALAWVDAAHIVVSPCPDCTGTGMWKGGSGDVCRICYPCAGKGWQSDYDKARNAAYHQKRAAREEQESRAEIIDAGRGASRRRWRR